MLDNPVFAHRREIQDYLRSCEHLLAAAISSTPFTQEERAMVGFYAPEIQKILAMPIGKKGGSPYVEQSSE